MSQSPDEHPDTGVGGVGQLVTEPPASGRITLERTLMAITLLLVIALGIVITGYVHQRNQAADLQRSTDSARSALAAAKVVAKDFTTYNFKTLTKDFARTRPGLAPSFATKYDQTTKQLVATLTEYQASSTSKVKDAAVVSASGSKAVVIAFIDQTIANSTAKQPRTDRIRMKLTLERKRGSWLVSGLDLV